MNSVTVSAVDISASTSRQRALCYALYQSRNNSEKVQTIRKNRIQIRNTALFFIAYTPSKHHRLHSTRPTHPPPHTHTQYPQSPCVKLDHVEFLKNLGLKARIWLSKFFSRIMATHSLPKIWRKAKVIAVENPGKDPSLAANYRPISLLS